MQKQIALFLNLVLIILAVNHYGQSGEEYIRELSSAIPEKRGLAACHLGENRVHSAIPELLKLLGDSQPIDMVACGDRGQWKDYEPSKSSSPGIEAARSLGSFGDLDIQPLITVLRDGNDHARRNAALALGFVKNQVALEPLLAALKDGSPDVRGRVIFALTYLKNQRAVMPLIGSLADENADVRTQAAWALGVIKDTVSVEPLIIAASDSAVTVRRNAVWSLGVIKDPRTIKPLISALSDTDESVREKAAWWLGSKKAVTAIDVMIMALQDPGVKVRSNAAYGLGNIGSPAALPALRKALKDSDKKVRKDAKEAIENIERKQAENISLKNENTCLKNVDLIITDVVLIDGTGEPPKSNMTIFISENRIVGISGDRGSYLCSGAKVINASGMYAIPGLWDMHVHLSLTKESSLPILVANGVTSVRDMGGDLDELKAMRERVRTGAIIGPRIKLSGPSLESPESVKRAKAKGKKQNFDRTRIVVAKPEDAEPAIRNLLKLGVDFIKIRTYPSVETYLAIAKAAKQSGIQLVGHPVYEMDPIALSNSGLASLEHGFYPYPPERYSAAERKKIIEAFVKNKTALVPTLITWQPRTIPVEEVEAIVEDKENKLDFRRKYLSPELIEDWRAQLVDRKNDSNSGTQGWQEVLDKVAKDTGEMFRAGVIVMPGTDDAGILVFPGFSLHDELQIFVEKAGMTPMQAIESATRVPAEFFGMQDNLGTLEKGKIADIVLLNANPLVDIKNTRKIVGVVLGGKFFERSILLTAN